MRVDRLADDKFRLDVSREELGTLGNCLNEVCNGIELSEFQTRVGVSREEVQVLLQMLNRAYKET